MVYILDMVKSWSCGKYEFGKERWSSVYWTTALLQPPARMLCRYDAPFLDHWLKRGTQKALSLRFVCIWICVCHKKTQDMVNDCITVYGHFSAVTFFSRLGDFSQIVDWYFRGWRAQTTRKFLFCSITSITCSKSRSWYFRGLDANRENMVTAGKRRFTVDIHRNWGHPSSSIFKSCMGIGRVKST